MSSNLDVGGPAEKVRTPERAALPAPRVPAPGARPRAAVARERWETYYVVATIASDTVAVVLSVLVGYLLGLGTHVPWLGEVTPGVGVLAGLLVLLFLYLCRAWDPRVLGQGSDEFGRLLRAMVTAAVALGMIGLAGQALAARPWVFGLIPLAGVLAAIGRLVLRARIRRLRARGRCALPVLAVGNLESVTDLIDRIRRDEQRGWVVVGACVPTGVGPDGADSVAGVPVLGDLDAVAEVAREGSHRIVAVCPAPGWSPARLHQLAWSIEDLAAELVVDPGLMDVSGPRLHVDPVDGLPLLRLTRPTFTGVAWIAKHVVDRFGAVLLLVLIAPVLLAVAVAVKLDGGPVLFRQTRVGRHGREFTMFKFRSMVVDAERRLAELSDGNDGAGPLFKMRKDPRVTRVGAFLRRFSIDELPQLFNVVNGTMSLVGPRPPLPVEVATYGLAAQRRLLVRPGLTGLWQISGRSDLTWEQSVRLDLRYVENWNLALDALILWKTFGAVVSSRGAY
ncbi:MAG: sugar transferase [Pseudonocardia sp.]|nr:sugar transferase [Pseudonocardia sp.]ODU26040.1 MAG: exopolysaccharide biosynthesis polyprenyl glycosylphosphotransferase [Pseudonocardia sp. SCN 72-51]ODV07222.1 MAG: exopolysaccharide biosynthesis polyprenyl glycosylphosphotransferase [Pseudonocardia sp. SCN 73-27]